MLPLEERTPQGGWGWKKGLPLALSGVHTGWGAWWPLRTCDVTFVKAVAALQLTSRSLQPGCAIIKGASEIIVSECSCTVTPAVTTFASILCVSKSKPKSINY